jgi:orotidine-5'-phosphate decarboxylase
MNRTELIHQIRKKKSFLCVGLDTDIQKIPKHLLDTGDAVFAFNKAIIDATQDYCVSYKLNTAFYESLGIAGWQSLIKTINYIPDNLFIIADAKRGDIGNTSMMYAKTFFDKTCSGMSVDAVTVNPYMGEDSVRPFLEFYNKWTIILAHTSNKGSQDFQLMKEQDETLFERVLRVSVNWGNKDNTMYVVGATHPDTFKLVRRIVPEHFLLVPGVGAQGGSLREVVEQGMIQDVGLLINSSRQIIYASSDKDFAVAAQEEAIKMQQQMSQWL